MSILVDSYDEYMYRADSDGAVPSPIFSACGWHKFISFGSGGFQIDFSMCGDSFAKTNKIKLKKIIRTKIIGLKNGFIKKNSI